MTEFWRISGEAREKLSETYNFPDVIPYGDEILKLIDKNPDFRHKFETAFIQSYEETEKSDPVLIQFCMHALRWPKVKHEFEALSRDAVENNNWNRINALQHILDAFEDEWEDSKDFYASYFNKQDT